jgi:hypothetical protein
VSVEAVTPGNVLSAGDRRYAIIRSATGATAKLQLQGSYRDSLTSDCAGRYALANGAHIIRESAALVLIVLGGSDADSDIAPDLMVAEGPPPAEFIKAMK